MAYRTRNYFNNISEAWFLWFMAERTRNVTLEERLFWYMAYNPLTGNRTDKGSGKGKKLSAGISISLGLPVVLWKRTTSWGTICCLVDQVLSSNLRYIMDVNGRRNLLMATEHEDPTALVIFLGIFLGTGRVFR